MKHKLVTLVLAVVVITSLVIVGCAKPAPAPAPSPAPAPAPAPTPPAGPEEILIGSSESATGMFSGFAAGGIFGMKVAVDDINKQGGIYVKEYGRKLPVKFILLDNESDPIKAASLAESLILKDKVCALVNGPGSATMFNPQSALAESYKVPYIPGEGPVEPWQAARMTVTPPWEYTWGFGFAIATPAPPGDFRYGKLGYTVFDSWFPALKAVSDQTNKTAAIFASDDADGRGWYKTFGPELEKRGYNVIGEERNVGLFPMGTMDFTPAIKVWKDNNCEIMWGNSDAPDFGTLWRQCNTEGYVPKLVLAGRAAMFYQDVSAWGGDLPQGVLTDAWWRSDYPPEEFPCIGDTTPQSLFERWHEETGQPLNQALGWGYFPMQVLFDAIERAGTLDGVELNKAIGETDMMTISGRAVFTKDDHHCRLPLALAQWVKTDEPWIWECPIVFSQHDFVKATAKPIFPLPTTTFK